MKGRAYAHTRPCHTCTHRTWRSLHGFMVMGCGQRDLRFGIAPDLARGHVNKAGNCVPMPGACAMASQAGHSAPR
ncbi:MAG TPA: hypothetical protein VKC56_08475 [Gallionellaceae bacterium]|nr:hypothetical protein [Gallionellaceae bacterium]